MRRAWMLIKTCESERSALETGDPIPTIGPPGNDAMSSAVSWTHATSVLRRARADLASDRRVGAQMGVRPAPACSKLLWHARACAAGRAQTGHYVARRAGACARSRAIARQPAAA